MKSQLLIGAFAVALVIAPVLILVPDVANAQSGGRKGADVIQKCYNDQGKPVPCGKLQQKK